MSYFADLTPHTYTEREAEDGVLNIGWLGEGHAFPTGEASADFVAALGDLCSRPVSLHRGFHSCEYCGGAKGNGQIRVCSSSGMWYAAPQMVYHYVEAHRYLPPTEFIDAVIHPLHIADSTTEADLATWRRDILSIFPDWKTVAATQRWPAVKARLQVDQPVKGRVIARAQFGVWIDIGVGHPALLLVPNMWRAASQPIAFVEYPPKGTTVRAWIDAIGDDCEIGLIQK